MIKYLLFSNSQKKKSTYSLKSKKKSMISKSLFATALMMALAGSTVKGQSSQVIPVDNSVASSTFTFLNTAIRNVQLIIDDTQLTHLSGKYIKSIAFRLPNTSTASWPTTQATFPSFDVYLSDGVDPANRQLSFAGNVVGTQTLVRSGALVIPPNSFPTSTSADPYAFQIEFSTPWFYSGSNLVIELRHTGITGASATSVAGVTTSATGYGSLFTAVWSSNATSAPNGAAFSSVKINVLDNLGVKSVEIGSDMTVFPNPVKDVLNVKSTSEISELYILNAAGQKIHSQKTSSNAPQIPVSNLVKGIYFLQTLDKSGNMKSTKFIKD